jgi:mannitol-specific phosphotransferase system IIBC component
MASIDGKNVHKVVVACDAGMGSSVLPAIQLRTQLTKYFVSVEHTPVNQIPGDADVVLCHVGLADRARVSAPDKIVVPFQIFLTNPAVAHVVAAVNDGGVVSE